MLILGNFRDSQLTHKWEKLPATEGRIFVTLDAGSSNLAPRGIRLRGRVDFGYDDKFFISARCYVVSKDGEVHRIDQNVEGSMFFRFFQWYGPCNTRITNPQDDFHSITGYCGQVLIVGI